MVFAYLLTADFVLDHAQVRRIGKMVSITALHSSHLLHVKHFRVYVFIWNTVNIRNRSPRQTS